MSRRWIAGFAVFVGITGIIAVAGAVGFLGGKSAYRSEAAKERMQEQAVEADYQRRLQAATDALPRLEDSRRMPFSEQIGKQLDYMLVKYKGRNLPCGDKWEGFRPSSGAILPYCCKGHAFEELGSGNLIPIR